MGFLLQEHDYESKPVLKAPHSLHIGSRAVLGREEQTYDINETAQQVDSVKAQRQTRQIQHRLDILILEENEREQCDHEHPLIRPAH